MSVWRLITTTNLPPQLVYRRHESFDALLHFGRTILVASMIVLLTLKR